MGISLAVLGRAAGPRDRSPTLAPVDAVLSRPRDGVRAFEVRAVAVLPPQGRPLRARRLRANGFALRLLSRSARARGPRRPAVPDPGAALVLVVGTGRGTRAGAHV